MHNLVAQFEKYNINLFRLENPLRSNLNFNPDFFIISRVTFND
jgi:hypothetical protein